MVALLAARHEVLALQVLAPQELAPALRGLLRLVDLETGRSRVVTVGKSALLAYREALAAHNRALADFCAARGITYRLIPSSADPIEAVLALLSGQRPGKQAPGESRAPSPPPGKQGQHRAAALVVVLLYFLRRQARKAPAPALFLWERLPRGGGDPAGAAVAPAGPPPSPTTCGGGVVFP
ncbi:hypothetical protein LR090_00960, partial [Candidatus Bipolaricaulota bacterium]|nr:hypothetical protein [Candidatus Bipolaricaulota bacterium]